MTKAEGLHAVPHNPHAALIGDLVTGQGILREAYDCMILTQTFPFIYDACAAIATVYAALKPGGGFACDRIRD